ncbi:hypothetical protein quinque_007346 [Culex quinquefasciatus]
MSSGSDTDDYSPPDSPGPSCTALANLPQDVLMSLLQTGQIQLHNEDGVQQYITIPLSLMSTLNNASKPDPKNNSNANGSANQQSAKPNSATTNRSSPSSSSSSRKSSSASSKEITIKTEVND